MAESDPIAAFEARAARERRAREAAEALLEQKSRELYDANKQLEASLEELKDTQTQLVHASKMEALGTLAGGIAHEINTPIQFINDNLHFIEESMQHIADYLDAVQTLRGALENTDTAETERTTVEERAKAADLSYLTTELPLAISQSLEGVRQVTKIVGAMKVLSHRGNMEKAPADLNEALENARTICRNEWKHAAEVNLDLDPSLPTVPCHLAGLNQVFLNIIINAAQAISDSTSGEMGRIDIATTQKDDTVEICIADNGPGMTDIVRQRVFDPFFTTKDVGKGTGQGLAICHDVVVNQHGGTLDCESEPGVGTAFIIRLPLVADSPNT